MELAGIIVTGVPRRTGRKYRERGYRHLYWDAGVMLAQLLALGSSAGLEASLISRFPDATLDSLVGADGVHEFALAVVSLGSVALALAPSGAAVGGGVDSDPLEFPLVTAAQRAGCLRTWGEPWSPGEPTETSEVGPTVEEVVLRRGSQRLMDPTRGLPRSLLTTSMEVARRGIDLPHWVVVHDVECVAPGLYRWPDLATPLRDGTLRDELYRAGCDQGLPRDALRRGVGDPHRRPRRPWLPRGAARRGPGRGPAAPRGVRAGSTFLDPEIPELLGEPLEGLLFTCVGVPDNTSKPGGLPGSPVIRLVRSRVDDG